MSSVERINELRGWEEVGWFKSDQEAASPFPERRLGSGKYWRIRQIFGTNLANSAVFLLPTSDLMTCSDRPFELGWRRKEPAGFARGLTSPVLPKSMRLSLTDIERHLRFTCRDSSEEATSYPPLASQVFLHFLLF